VVHFEPAGDLLCKCTPKTSSVNRNEYPRCGFLMKILRIKPGTALIMSMLLLLLAAGDTVRAQQTSIPTDQTTPSSRLTLDEALKLASMQASAFQQASLNERSAAEDVQQARTAFLPHVSAPLSYLYTSPAMGTRPVPRAHRAFSLTTPSANTRLM
jgi:outer membrane protein TolC